MFLKIQDLLTKILRSCLWEGMTEVILKATREIQPKSNIIYFNIKYKLTTVIEINNPLYFLIISCPIDNKLPLNLT